MSIAALSPRKVAVFNGVNPLGQEVTTGRMRQEYAHAGAQLRVRDREEEEFVPLLEPFLLSEAR